MTGIIEAILKHTGHNEKQRIIYTNCFSDHFSVRQLAVPDEQAPLNDPHNQLNCNIFLLMLDIFLQSLYHTQMFVNRSDNV